VGLRGRAVLADCYTVGAWFFPLLAKEARVGTRLLGAVGKSRFLDFARNDKT
jgi:hypothetical protein